MVGDVKDAPETSADSAVVENVEAEDAEMQDTPAISAERAKAERL